MIRVDIESILMASGPMPSVIVLRERSGGEASDAPLRSLSIPTGAYEAAAIGRKIDGDDTSSRPITHDLLLSTVHELGAKVERVEINRWAAPIFFADIVYACTSPSESRGSGGDGAGQGREIKIDARPSDALALAMRSNAPIYVEDDVMNRAGSISVGTAQGKDSSQEEIERFDEFVQTLSPDDF